ncbi:ABC transporter permease [Nocardioides taihuensis]|uniref:ABC transporter permease n=1 Tax=Nocardioides taihuensis TaxID=1835606 RepID=A0ABW0BK59_9ACTN
MTTTEAAPAPARPAAPPAPSRRGVLADALRWEVRKLRRQYRARVALLGALVGPVLVVVVVHGQSRPPKDTLFGRYALDNGFALSLLVLGFATQWVLPLLTALVAGDIFASEDHHGTWKTVLTRSTGRGTVFWAKTLAAAGFAVLVVLVLGASTITSSLLIVGHQPLTGLTGQLTAPSEALRLVSLSWVSVLAPTLGFTCLALLLSVWSRNPAVGIAAPVVIAMVMQLVGALGGVEPLRPFLLSTPFESWHGLLADPRFTGPLLGGLVTSAVWCAVCLGLGHLVLRRRDITGG